MTEKTVDVVVKIVLNVAEFLIEVFKDKEKTKDKKKKGESK